MENKTGLDLQESADINIDGCHTMKAQHEEDYTIEAAHEEALSIDFTFNMDAFCGYQRMPFFMAQIDAQEMLNFRIMDEAEAWDAYEAEEARKAN